MFVRLYYSMDKIIIIIIINLYKTRFPARIKATSSAMNKVKKYGKYNIIRENKIITVKPFED